MLFAAKRHDISDQVLRVITRAERRQQLSKKVKGTREKEYEEDVMDEKSGLDARKKALEDKKAAREKAAADKREAAEAAKAEKEAKRKELLDAKLAKKNGTVPAKAFFNSFN